MKFCVGKQFSQNTGNGRDTRVLQNIFVVFPNAVWVSASGAFRIVSDTLVYLAALTRLNRDKLFLVPNVIKRN